MTQTPAVSVIIPLYNKAAYILRAVRSALEQQPEPHEILVIDDGSTDNGLSLLEEMPEFSRIRIVRQSNAGEGAARNRGLREMRGSLAAFLDADDEWLPGHLRDIVDLATLYPQAGLFATGFRSRYHGSVAVETKIAADAPVLIPDYFETALGGFCIHISSCAVWKSVAHDAGGFVEREPLGADLDFYARVALTHPVALHPRISGIYYAANAGSAIHAQTWTNRRPPVVQLLRGTRASASPRAQSAAVYADWILAEHALTGLISGRKDDAAKLLDEIQSSPGTPFYSLPLVRFAARWLPLAAVQTLIRFRRSRFAVSNSRRPQVVVNRVVSQHV